MPRQLRKRIVSSPEPQKPATTAVERETTAVEPPTTAVEPETTTVETATTTVEQATTTVEPATSVISFDSANKEKITNSENRAKDPKRLSKRPRDTNLATKSPEKSIPRVLADFAKAIAPARRRFISWENLGFVDAQVTSTLIDSKEVKTHKLCVHPNFSEYLSDDLRNQQLYELVYK